MEELPKPAVRRAPDWKAIRDEYEGREFLPAMICKRHGVTLAQLRYRREQEGWALIRSRRPQLAVDPPAFRHRAGALPDRGTGVLRRPCRRGDIRPGAGKRRGSDLCGGVGRGTEMTNIHRGEIDAEIGGEVRTLCLTLGALAELEARLGAGDLAGLAERFAEGRISARDLTAILGAGLRGGGNALTDDDLARMSVEGGLRGAAEIAVRLLRATFGENE